MLFWQISYLQDILLKGVPNSRWTLVTKLTPLENGAAESVDATNLAVRRV